MEKQINLFMETRGTGQGKTYDMANYVINNPNKKILIISSNVSNIEDCKNEIAENLLRKDNRKEEWIDYLVQIKNHTEAKVNKFKQDKKDLEYYINKYEEKLKNTKEKLAKNEITSIKSEINTYKGEINSTQLNINNFTKEVKLINSYLLDNNFIHYFIEDLKINFVNKITNTLNSFFYTHKAIIIASKFMRGQQRYIAMPPSVQPLLDLKVTEDEEGKKHYTCNGLRTYDTIFIDEADKTLGSISLKQEGLSVSYYSFDRDDLKKIDINKDHNILGIYKCADNYYINHIVDQSVFNSVAKEKQLKDFCTKHNIKYELITDEVLPKQPVITTTFWEKYSKLQVQKSKTGNMYFISSDSIATFLKSQLNNNGNIVFMSATNNPVLNGVIKSLGEVKKESFFKNSIIYHKPITYFLKQLEKDAYVNNDIFIIKPNANKVIKYSKSCTYLSAPKLRGNNTLGVDYRGLFFDFNLSDIRQAPCNARLSYFCKVGNQYLTNPNEVLTCLQSYHAFSNEFEVFKKNLIIQAVGRMNRGLLEKTIYYVEDEVGSLIEDYLSNKLNQKVVKC